MTSTRKCHRCQGKGRIEAFSHVRGGMCFRCTGLGTIDPAAEKAAKADYAARTALCANFPSLRELATIGEAAGMDWSDAMDLAKAYEASAYGDIWDEDRVTGKFTADQVAEASALFEGAKA